MENSEKKRKCPTRALLSRLMFTALFSLATVVAFAQGKTRTGVVLDETGEPVTGANVVVVGTTNGIITDTDGHFTLSNVADNAKIRVSYVGYMTQEVPVAGKTHLQIQLVEDTQALEEVVVVGYGVQRKSDVTGSLTSVSEKQLKERPVVNVMEALQGKAAGVDITNNGRPGEIGDIRIRGERSITGSSSPLYVVDGIPMQGRTNINMINTNDIKSVEILKDASATAIYGSRGANGVILITTHGGEDGRFSVNYNGSTTVETLQDSREHFTAAEWIDFVRWAYYYSDANNVEPKPYPVPTSPTKATDQLMFGADLYAWRNVENGWAGNQWDGSKVATTDWASYVIQTGITQNHTVNVSGGTKKISSYVSVGYLDQKGTSQGQAYKRYTLNSNTKITPTDWFEMGLRVNGSWQEQEYGQDRTGATNSSGPASIYESAMRLYPYAVPFDDDGNRILFPGGMASLKTVVDEPKYSHNLRQVMNLMANGYAQIKLPLDGLIYRIEFGPGYRFRRNGVFVDPNSAIRENQYNHVTLNNERDFTWTVNNTLNYNKKFDLHTVGVTLLQTASKDEEVEDNINGRNQPVASALWNAMGTINLAEDITGVGSSLSEDQLASYMARFTYNFNDRYLLTATGRWDGSSRLAPGHKWDFFPSIGLGWRIEQEDFLKPVTWVNQLKLRFGYGVVGNAAVDRYTTIGSINSSIYPYGASLERFYYVNDLLATSTRLSMPNLMLGWEKTAQYNIAVDYSVFKNRIAGSFDFYTSRTSDLLLNSSIPSLTGYVSTTANVGITQNYGVDFSLNTLNVDTKDFTWETNFTLSYQKNKIVELSNGKEDEIQGNSRIDSRFIGYPIGVYYDYVADGLWKEEDAAEMARFNSDLIDPNGDPNDPDNKKTAHNFKVGQTKPKDLNGDYVIDSNHDRAIIGQRNPNWTGGMTNTFTYKGIELAMQLYYRLNYWTDGGSVAMGGKYMLRKVDYYTENNTDAAYQRPQLTSDGGDADTYSSALQYSKASFVNIRNISLGYSFPKKLIRNWYGLQSLKVYAQCINPGALYSSVDWKNMDLNSSVWNRNFVVGLNVGF